MALSKDKYTQLRLLKTERRGKYFQNPVSKFLATTGAANTGPQITLRIAITKGVQSIQLLRNVSRDPGSAKILTSYQVAPPAAGAVQINKDTTYHDSDPSIFGRTVYYFLRIVPLHTSFAPLLQGPLSVAVP
jgi:hypothetical protein